MNERLFSFDSDCVVTHTTADQSDIDKNIPSQYCEWWKREHLKRVAEHQRNLEIDARNRAEKRKSEKPTGEHKMPLNDQQTEIKDG